MKDKSNERIQQEILKLAEFMDKEGRGFIFAPLPQRDSNHKTFLAVQGTGEQFDEEFLTAFWAGMLSIIRNMHPQVPEDLLPTFKKQYKAFLKASMVEFNMGAIEL